MPTSQEWLTFANWGKKWEGGSNYSDRPRLEMGGDLWAGNRRLSSFPMEPVSAISELFHQSIGSQSSMVRFHPGGEMETHRFLKRVLANPDDLSAHVRKTAGSVILRISHGYEVKENEDPFQFALSTAPGGFLVNLVPAHCHRWAATLQKMAEGPHQFVKEQMEQEYDIKWSAASLYSGGADTAQEEIDSVTGNERLPCFADRPNLPYVNALQLEVFRWHSVVPTAVFGPNQEPDPKLTAFGFGRRICRVMADASVFISIAMSLAVFNVTSASKDEVLVHEQMTGTISHPKPFKCSITPRSNKAIELIQGDHEV
ncbi:cytochrome P450 [Pholiota molesta]|nr:cytochrome P450 [Pholiota molesta]